MRRRLRRRLMDMRQRMPIPGRARRRTPRFLRRRPPTMLLVGMAVAGTLMTANVMRRRAVRARTSHQRADVSFMIAMHDALRRDLDRLLRVAPTVDHLSGIPVG